MEPVGRVKSVSYLEAHAAEMIRDLAAGEEPYVITVDGEAAAVIQDVASYEAIQEKMAFLRLLAMAENEIAEDKIETLEQVKTALRQEFGY